MERLTRDALAAESETTVERVDELVLIGALRAADDGSFSSGDIRRIRVVDAYEASGIGLDLIALAIARRWMTFERTDDLYPDPGPRSTRTFVAFRESLGERAELLPHILAALGLPVPEETMRLAARDEIVIRGFLDAWDVGPDETVAVRAARLIGEPMRRTVDGWVELFAEHVTRPLEDRTRTVDEVIPIVLPRGAGILQRAPEFLTWLFQRHLETALDAVNTASMETGLAREGMLPPRPRMLPAIAFVDLAGYTRLTEERGDELAARSAGLLAQIAGDVARSAGGRLVKLLGDGAMLHFPEAEAAVSASLDLVAAAPDAGLPAAHAGVHAGPVIGRDGDFFGHTVNLAARLAGRADPGTVLVSRGVVDSVEARPAGDMPSAGLRFVPLGEIALRNVRDPIAVFRAERGG
jgi:adenylate cyclase